MTFRILEIAWLVAYLAALGWMLRFNALRRRKQQAAPAAVQADIMNAVGVYLCGNSDLARLKGLAGTHPGEVRETILRYQSLVAGQRDELSALAIALGFAQTWWYDAQSRDLRERRTAFAALSALAYYEPVRVMAAGIARQAFHDSDEQVRLDAARILLAGGDAADINRVFAEAMAMAPEARAAISNELAPHAAVLCQTAIPQALGGENPLPVLSMLTSWERALPLAGVESLPRHQDRAVRLETMRLLPYLPATAENEAAFLAGLADEDPQVREAAAAAIRLGAPKLDCAANAAASTLRHLQAEIKDLGHRLASSASPLLETAHAGTIACPFVNWRMLDA